MTVDPRDLRADGTGVQLLRESKLSHGSFIGFLTKVKRVIPRASPRHTRGAGTGDGARAGACTIPVNIEVTAVRCG